MLGKTKSIPSTQKDPMDSPTLTTMVVLYTMGVKLNTDTLVHELPLTERIIKIEKQGVLRRGKYWGIGTSADTSKAKDPERWPGKNVLGKILMELRSELKDS